MANPNVHDGAPMPADGGRAFTAVGGNDGTSNRELHVNADGSINVTATSTVTGTVKVESASGADIGGGSFIQNQGDGDALLTKASMTQFNGTDGEMVRGNLSGTLLASAARTGTTSSTDQTNHNGQAVAITLNVTAVPGGDTITPAIEAKDPVSGTYTAILTGAARATTGTVRMRVGTNITAAANLAAADVLGRTWRVTVTHSAGTSFTYSVGYDLMTA